MRRLARTIAQVALIAALCAPTSVRADDERASEADRHLSEAKRRYEAADYAGAIEAATAGNAVEPRADFWYLMGQSERMRGDCRKAVEHYQSALALAHSHAQKGLIRIQIERCERDAKPEPSPSPSPSPITSPPPAPSPSPSPAPRQWYRDLSGGLLLGFGLAITATGAGLLGHSAPIIRSSGNDVTHYENARSVEGMYIAGITLVTTGVVALAGSIIRYALVRKRR